jgi:hypothetical protein
MVHDSISLRLQLTSNIYNFYGIQLRYRRSFSEVLTNCIYTSISFAPDCSGSTGSKAILWNSKATAGSSCYDLTKKVIQRQWIMADGA